MPQIKYIGKKDFMPDFIAQSGKCWNGYGDVQDVTDEQAKKLLVHDDEFAEKGAHDALLIEQEEERAKAEAEAAAEAEAQRIAAEEAAAAEAAALAGKENPDAPTPNTPATPAAPAVGLADAVKPQVPAITADEIKAMNKADLIALAEQNGAEINKSAPVPVMRKQMIAALVKNTEVA